MTLQHGVGLPLVMLVQILYIMGDTSILTIIQK